MLADPNEQFQRCQGDLKPEIHFFGQIVGGSGFLTDEEDGLFCEMAISTKWVQISDFKLLEMDYFGFMRELFGNC